MRLEVDTRPVVLIGPNGAGKTNILEAISLLSPGKGFRQVSSSELVKKASIRQPWAVSTSLWSSKGKTQIGVGFDPDSFARGREKKVIRVDGDMVRSQATLGEYLQVMWLTPQMDRLFQGPPQDRRRFLDRLVFGVDGDHARKLKVYEHAMRERLRLIKEDRQDDAWLCALEENMVQEGLGIMAARANTINLLTKQLQQATTLFPRAQLGMKGWLDEVFDHTQAKEIFSAKLAENRRVDGLIGMTKIGPHRSDLTCLFSEYETPADQCSTGEQKALLLSIILAAARLQKDLRKGVPILLLDEVVAHLDASRRANLFDEIEALSLQTWMTGTDFELFSGLGERSQYFHVENSTVSVKTVV